MNLFYFFSKTSCRQAYLFKIEQHLGLEELVVLHHQQSLCLTLIPALEHLVKIKEAWSKLILDGLPKMTRTNKGIKSMW